MAVMAGPCDREQGGKRACKTISLGAVQTLQPKVRFVTRAHPRHCNLDKCPA